MATVGGIADVAKLCTLPSDFAIRPEAQSQIKISGGFVQRTFLGVRAPYRNFGWMFGRGTLRNSRSLSLFT